MRAAQVGAVQPLLGSRPSQWPWPWAWWRRGCLAPSSLIIYDLELRLPSSARGLFPPPSPPRSASPDILTSPGHGVEECDRGPALSPCPSLGSRREDSLADVPLCPAEAGPRPPAAAPRPHPHPCFPGWEGGSAAGCAMGGFVQQSLLQGEAEAPASPVG